MSMGPKQRWMLLIGLLGLTFAATAWVSQEEEPAAPVHAKQSESTQHRTSTSQEKASPTPDLKLDKLQREQNQDKAPDLFEAKSWYVPPPSPKPLPPPPPSAPPLPFVYMGKMIDDGQLTIFLTKQDRNYVVKVGETLEGMYKIESVTPNMMTLIYLPLNIKQTLMIGGE